MTQRTSRRLNAGQVGWYRWMFGKNSAIFAVSLEHFLWIEPFDCQHLEQGCGAVALAQDETVAIRITRILRIDAQGREISRNQDVRARQARAQMRRRGLVRILDDARPDFAGQLLEFFDLHTFSNFINKNKYL